MRYIKQFEKFNKDAYLKRKSELEKYYKQKMIDDLGDEFVTDIIASGDIDNFNYLLDTGYNLDEFEGENIYVTALKNNQIKMLEYLVDKNFFDYKNGAINSISLSDIIGQKQYDNESKQKITPQMVEWMKIMTKYGYKWYDENYNYFDLWLSYTTYDNGTYGTYLKKLYDGLEPFIDWLLKNYPENYKLVKEFLSEKLLKKYKYLDNADKYNI